MSNSFEPGGLSLARMRSVWEGGDAPHIADNARTAIDQSAARIAQIAEGDAPVYGVNTGFGKLATMRIAPEDTAQLQRNLILSHCAGVGDPLPRADTRLMMLLKVNSLARGASGVRWDVVAQLEAMLAADVWPDIPEQGSVGASGEVSAWAVLEGPVCSITGDGSASS